MAIVNPSIFSHSQPGTSVCFEMFTASHKSETLEFEVNSDPGVPLRVKKGVVLILLGYKGNKDVLVNSQGYCSGHR